MLVDEILLSLVVCGCWLIGVMIKVNLSSRLASITESVDWCFIQNFGAVNVVILWSRTLFIIVDKLKTDGSFHSVLNISNLVL